MRLQEILGAYPVLQIHVAASISAFQIGLLFLHAKNTQGSLATSETRAQVLASFWRTIDLFH